MTRMDDAVSIALFIMTLVAVPYTIMMVPGIRSGLVEGNWEMIYNLGMSSWTPLMYGTLLLCSIILIAGVAYD